MNGLGVWLALTCTDTQHTLANDNVTECRNCSLCKYNSRWLQKHSTPRRDSRTIERTTQRERERHRVHGVFSFYIKWQLLCDDAIDAVDCELASEQWWYHLVRAEWAFVSYTTLREHPNTLAAKQQQLERTRTAHWKSGQFTKIAVLSHFFLRFLLPHGLNVLRRSFAFWQGRDRSTETKRQTMAIT